MGLDWIVAAKAKPGYEQEYVTLRKKISWNLPFLNRKWKRRIDEIVAAPYTKVGAPQVGFDEIATDWALQQYADTERSDCTREEFLEQLHGYYVVQLAKSPGAPPFTHGGLYDGVDYTSFRGSCVMSCSELITEDLTNRGYLSFAPTEAILYGKSLFERASTIASLKGLDATTARSDPHNDPLESLAGQLEIFRSASEWFHYWGEAGHGIDPWA